MHYHYHPSDAELSEFYSSLGKTICEFQKFEYLVAVVLCVMKNDEFGKVEEAWRALDADFAKTLGKLNRQLNANVTFVETFRFHLAEVVHERNWIVHGLPNAMYIFMRERREFERLLSRLRHTHDSCSTITSMLEKWFFGHEEYKRKIHSLPKEVHENFVALNRV